MANNKAFENPDLGEKCCFIMGMNSYLAAFFSFFSIFLVFLCGSLSICSGSYDVSSGQGLRF